jgi:NCAIR mutase (PurE)-related protein
VTTGEMSAIEPRIADTRTRPGPDVGFARLDLDRLERTGDPEVVFGAGKSPEQISTPSART